MLSIGNKSAFPDKMLKQTESSRISELNGVPELNCIYSLFDINCLYTVFPRSVSFSIDLNKLCTSSNITNPFDIASIFIIRLSFNEKLSLNVINTQRFRKSSEFNGFSQYLNYSFICSRFSIYTYFITSYCI